jgi:hypothetical protein
VERLEHFEALGDLLDLGFRIGAVELLAQLVNLAIEIDLTQQLTP